MSSHANRWWYTGGVECLGFLTRFSAAHNQLQDTAAMGALVRLATLDLSHNGLRACEELVRAAAPRPLRLDRFSSSLRPWGPRPLTLTSSPRVACALARWRQETLISLRTVLLSHNQLQSIPSLVRPLFSSSLLSPLSSSLSSLLSPPLSPLASRLSRLSPCARLHSVRATCALPSFSLRKPRVVW